MSFFWTCIIFYYIRYMHTNNRSFIHLSTNGQLDSICFLLSLMSLRWKGQCCMLILFPLAMYPLVGLLDPMAAPLLVLWETIILFFTVTILICILTCFFPPSSPAFAIVCLFRNRHSGLRGYIIAASLCTCWPLHILFWEMFTEVKKYTIFKNIVELFFINN